MKKIAVVFISLLSLMSAMLCGCSERNSTDAGSVRDSLGGNSAQISLDGYEKPLLLASWDYKYSGVEELSSDCDIIAKVKVTSQTNGPKMTSRLMSTIFTAKVEDLIYGFDEKEIDIFMTGGIDHDQKIIWEISDDPLMNIGDEFIVFADKNEDGTYTILGGPQGRFVIDNDCIYSLTEYNSAESAEGINVLAVGGENLNDFIEEVKSYII